MISDRKCVGGVHVHDMPKDNSTQGNRYKKLFPWGQHAHYSAVKDYLGWTIKRAHKLRPTGKCWIILVWECHKYTPTRIYTWSHHCTVAERQVLHHMLSHLSVQANKLPAGQRASRCMIQMSCTTNLTDVNKQQHSWIFLFDHLKLLDIITCLLVQSGYSVINVNVYHHNLLFFVHCF